MRLGILVLLFLNISVSAVVSSSSSRVSHPEPEFYIECLD